MARRQQSHHRTLRIKLLVKRFNFRCFTRGPQPHIQSGKNPALEGQQMRGENKIAGREPQMLSYFRRVTVRKQTIGAKIFIYLYEMGLALRLFSRAAHARFTITDDPVRRIDPSSFDERPQSKNYRSRVA